MGIRYGGSVKSRQIGQIRVGANSSKGRVQSYRQTWWCLVLTEAVLQEVFDLNPIERT